MQENTEVLKGQAKAIRKALKERGVEVSHSDMLEAISRAGGFKDWNSASATVKRRGTAVVRTASGEIDLLNPSPSDIWINDIAKGLNREQIYGRWLSDVTYMSAACAAVKAASQVIKYSHDFPDRIKFFAEVSGMQLRLMIYWAPKAYLGGYNPLIDVEEIEKRLRKAAYTRFGIQDSNEQDDIVGSFYKELVSVGSRQVLPNMPQASTKDYLDMFYHLTNAPDPYMPDSDPYVPDPYDTVMVRGATAVITQAIASKLQS